MAADTLAYTLGELPFQQLLNMDEFNELVSGFMSNLTNQAITGLTGVLGLGGNDSFSNNSFGANGNQSYIDAMAADDITRYQTYSNNEIKASIKTETKYKSLQQKILDAIKELDDELERNEEEFPDCFDLELTDELQSAKETATTNLEISNTTLAVLQVLDSQYDGATDANTKNAVLSTYSEYKQQGFFRTNFDNQQLEFSYINYDFAEMVDEFKYDTATERYNCGGDFNYDGVLSDEADDADDEF